MMKFVSTRGLQQPVSAAQAIVQGLADDGGLFVPDCVIPKIQLETLLHKDYVQLATEILALWLPDYSRDLVQSICMQAYDKEHFRDAIVPVCKVGNSYVAELWHGRTAAFKDMALSLLPYLMSASLRMLSADRQVMILTATSGDTGKAALEGFRDIEGTQIAVFYPTEGVSMVQKQQMITQQGRNVHVTGIRGNFDDAQRAVKAILNKRNQLQGNRWLISSANSINIGRLLPQIVYYVWSYLELVRKGELLMGESIRVCVPSGNFGNCLAAYIAREMGVPFEKFMVASNSNNVLTDFFTTGVYDANRPFYKTYAPAMDILVSSNLERLLWFVCDDKSMVAKWMSDLQTNGRFEVDNNTLTAIQQLFEAEYADDTQILDTIRNCYRETHYLLDTHTACAYRMAANGKVLIMSTASPYKFADTVWYALSGDNADAYQAMERLNAYTQVEIPEVLRGIAEREVLHSDVIDKSNIEQSIRSWLE